MEGAVVPVSSGRRAGSGGTPRRGDGGAACVVPMRGLGVAVGGRRGAGAVGDGVAAVDGRRRGGRGLGRRALRDRVGRGALPLEVQHAAPRRRGRERRGATASARPRRSAT